MKKIILTLSILALSALGASAAQASTVTRSVDNAAPNAGSALTVSLTVDVVEPDTFYIIDEIFPAGWVVSSPGTGDTTQVGHIKWAVISGAVDAVLQYTLTVPAGALGAANFSGEFAFDSNLVPVPILGANSVVVPGTLAVINVTPSAPTITGGTQQFTATALDQGGNAFPTTITWTSSNPAVGTIDATGLFTALSAGNTVITAASGAISGTANVTVQATLTTINITPATRTMLVSQTANFTASALDQFGNAMTPVITWTSSAPLIGTINPSGVFSSVALGTATITATSGLISGTATVNVVTDAPAILTLLGANPMTISLAATFVEPGFEANDTVDGILTPNVVVTGLPVNTATAGARTITYTVTDSIGNITSLTRTVNVVMPAGTDSALVLTQADWTIFSAPQRVSAIQITATDFQALLAFDAATQQFVQITDPADAQLLNPLNAFYARPNKVTMIGFTNAAPADPALLLTKNLSDNWNLISSANAGLVQNELSSIQTTINHSGMVTLFVPQTFNSRKGVFADFGVNANIDLNANPITQLPAAALSPFDGYWVSMNGADVYSKIAQ